MIFVTGGTGMLGAHLLYYLAENHKVRALKRTNSNLEIVKRVFGFFTDQVETRFANIEWVDGDITDYVGLCNVMEGVTDVYHVAALVSFDPADKKLMREQNVVGTENVVDICLKYHVRKLCYVSSIATLGGNLSKDLINEDISNLNDGKYSGYSKSKFLAEMEVWRGINEGLNAVIVNPSVIMGGGDWNKGSSAMIKKIWNGFKYYTEGITGFVDVNDVCKIMIQLMNSEIHSERFLLNAENLSFRTIFNLIADHLHKPRPSIYATPTLTQIAWRLEKIRSFFTRKKPLITSQSARSGHNKKSYSNQKITKALEFEFLPLEKSIAAICKQFVATNSFNINK